jgi:putative nucleotidyltransferase with HDIG domain
MSVPSRVDAAAVLRGLRPDPKLLRHSTAVAEVAAFLSDAMVRRGVALDAAAVDAAALLHDLDKMLPDDDPLKALGHGAAGAEWLRQHGLDALATAVASHPVMALGEAETYEAWAERAGLIGRVVTYADKRARQDVIDLTDRFARWHENYPDSPKLDEAERRAGRLELEICGLAGIKPSEVRRLSWVNEAMRAAA